MSTYSFPQEMRLHVRTNTKLVNAGHVLYVCEEYLYVKLLEIFYGIK